MSDPLVGAAPDAFASCGSLVAMLRSRARETGDHQAYLWLPESDAPPLRRSFAEVDRQARRVASLLRSAGSAGQRALLIYPQGLDFVDAFLGCLYAGTIAVPTHVPGGSRRSADRVKQIAVDAGAVLVLTTRKLLDTRRRHLDRYPELESLEWIATDDAACAGDGETAAFGRGAGEVAYLQYTSGSTADPRGVMITQDNLVHNLALQIADYGAPESASLVSWLPHFHDFGLLALCQPLYTGRPSILFSAASFAQRPLRWLETIAGHRATHSSAPNFAYDLCVSRSTPEERTGLDLSSWRCAINGAEPVRPQTLERFSEAFAPCGFRREAFCPAYGLAEATLKVSSIRTEEPPRVVRVRADELRSHRVVLDAGGEDPRTLASSGTPRSESPVRIVDAETSRPAARDRIGEIWVHSPSVGLGYWNRPEETRRTFAARLDDDGDRPYLRTGDLGFLHEGELYVTGRIKDLIIVRGVNHYPQDVELTVETAHESLNPGHVAAFSVETVGVERLVVVAEKQRRGPDTDVDALFTAVHRAVAEHHEIELYAFVLLRTGALPRTTSGKVRRRACREAFLDGTLEVVVQRTRDRSARSDREIVPARDGIEHRLVEIWQETLDVSPIGIHDRFLDLGGSSILALQLAGRMQEVFGRDIGLADLSSIHTIEQLAALLRGETGPSAWVSLVPLRAAGARAPLFVVHPAGGTVMCYDGLVRHIDEERPLYALQSRGIDGRHKTLKSVESMAAHYIEELRTAQPRGPYHLGGLCMGGIVALEMAVQLSREGETVDLLAVLDTRNPPGFRRPIRLRKLLQSWMGSSGNADQRRNLTRVWRDNLRARNRYKGGRFPGRIRLLWSEASARSHGDRVGDWEPFADNGVEVLAVPGAHRTLLQEPHVRVVAERLNELLDETGPTPLRSRPTARAPRSDRASRPSDAS